jgi:hypothetical protein
LRHLPKFVAILAAVAVSVTGTAGPAIAAPAATTPATPTWGTYQTVTPDRVLDTRFGTGAPKAPVGPDGTLEVNMLGTAGIPASGVSAVVLNLTVTGATAPSFLTVWPSGTARPNVSSINFVAGTNRANLVTVPVGSIGADAGKISIWNPAGTVQVVADVMGYYKSDAATTGGGYYQTELIPNRLLDTREAGSGGPLAPGESVPVTVDYNFFPGLELNAHVRALAVNITAVNPTKKGFLAAYDGGSVLPTTSTVNFAAGTVTPNMAIVPVGPCVDCGLSTGLPSIEIINQSLGTTDVLVDIVGLYDDGQTVDPDGVLMEGFRFRPTDSHRIVDTRSGLGATTFKGTAVNKSVPMPARSLSGPGTFSVVTNTTAVLPTQPTFVTLWANFGLPMPKVSNLNPAKGQTMANATITDLGFDSKGINPAFDIYNNQGTVDILVDVVGTMDYRSFEPPAAGLSAPAGPKTRPKAWTRKDTAQPVR